MKRSQSLAGAIDPMKIAAAPIHTVAGVGPKLASLLAVKGIFTVEDALYFLPRRYDDRRVITRIADAGETGVPETVTGTIRACAVISYPRGNRKVFQLSISDGTGTLVAKWFHFNYRAMLSRFKRNDQVVLSGHIKYFDRRKEVLHPDIEVIEPGEGQGADFRKILPVYSETEGLSQKVLRRIMLRVLDEYAPGIVDGIPESIRNRQGLMGLASALRNVHLPGVDDDYKTLLDGTSEAHHRLIFDELFFLQLGLALRKKAHAREVRQHHILPDKYYHRMQSLLPFTLTAAQKRALDEIMADLAKPYPMNRLLQGDVGSGKTIVAFIAALALIDNAYQVAFMAPTEILAEQHFRGLALFADQLGLRMVLLTGNGNRSHKEAVYQQIAQGEIDIVIGTHAIIQERVSFHSLGLAVIDEQHRFGVRQRALLKQKGMHADVLIMTATPIPRTLGLTIYGDLDCSIIDELPPGRMPVTTKLYREPDRKEVYQRIAKELDDGKQAFIVYPLVEESERVDLKNATDMARKLSVEIFPSYRVGLLHGRMGAEDKERIMAAFKGKDLDLLVATTVVEVGIDIPNATLMVVEHAERFGLTQLHQLRGRVGRGDAPAHCMLITHDSAGQDSFRRLRIIEETTDGFKIAEKDFALRGPGDILGVRQAGLPDVRVGHALYDLKTLHAARHEAFTLIDEDPVLGLPEHGMTRQVLETRWQGGLELMEIS